ncbi:MAG: hypothetical protein ACPG4T_15925 [Nannocystaceae bacterium]
MSQPPAQLLLTSEDVPLQPWLDGGCEPGAAAAEAASGPTYRVKNLRDLSGDANLLDRQKWALVIPATEEGRRLVALVEPLTQLRTQQQGQPVLVIEVPPGMNELEAQRWRIEQFPPLYRRVEADRPRYLLILGDLDGVSLATQQVLAIDGFPGRLVGDIDADYHNYVAKVLAHETQPSSFEHGRCLLYTVHDGTAATRSAHDQLIVPCQQHLQQELPAHEVHMVGQQLDPSPDDFLTLAGQPQPTVMFSVSHGLGQPRRKDWSPREARKRQGAMSFGRNGALERLDFASAPFIQGGIWIYFACYGAGTPQTSHFLPWIQLLARSGTPELQAFEKTLSTRGGFTSATVKTALANPNGPQAIVGHLDLAWSYSYESPRLMLSPQPGKVARSDRFHDLISPVIRGQRAGVIFLHMQLSLAEISKSILALTRSDQAAGRVSSQERANLLGRLWLMREDLRGYVLMGDPACRLPLGPPKMQATSPSSPPTATSNASEEDLERAGQVEEAVLKFLAGEMSKSQIQRAYGVSRREIEGLTKIYRDAGTAALAKHLAAAKSSQ